MSKRSDRDDAAAAEAAETAQVAEAARAAEVAELSKIPPQYRGEATNARLQELEVMRQQSLPKAEKAQK
jgi:pyridoxal biosynthesis lyase PdxS